MERLALCVLRVPYTNRLDMSLAWESPAGLRVQWNHFLRLFNDYSNDSPLIYLAVFARSLNGNPHAHVLTWTYPDHRPVRKAARRSGFGQPSLGARPCSMVERVRQVSYVLGQHVPVFGQTVHLRHEPLERGRRAFAMNQRRTLEARRPELFHALADWKTSQ